MVNHSEIATPLSKCRKLRLKDDLNHRFHASVGRLKMPVEQNRVSVKAHTAHAQEASLAFVHHLESSILAKFELVKIIYLVV